MCFFFLRYCCLSVKKLEKNSLNKYTVNSFPNFAYYENEKPLIKSVYSEEYLRRNIKKQQWDTKWMKMLLSVGLTFRNFGGLFGPSYKWYCNIIHLPVFSLMMYVLSNAFSVSGRVEVWYRIRYVLFIDLNTAMLQDINWMLGYISGPLGIF